MEAYMLQEKKVQLSDRSDQIEKFEQYVSLITRMFITSLEDYQNVKEAVKTELRAIPAVLNRLAVVLLV